MKGKNDINDSNLTNSDETTAGFTSLPAGDPEGPVTTAITDMYAENLDDYGESLNGNAADITKDRRRRKKGTQEKQAAVK